MVVLGNEDEERMETVSFDVEKEMDWEREKTNKIRFSYTRRTAIQGSMELEKLKNRKKKITEKWGVNCQNDNPSLS